MSGLRDLYQEVILDHGKKPRNFRKIEGANRELDGYNPLCGDKLKVYLLVRDDVVEDASFEGLGCAISTASASMMTESIKGKTVSEVEALFDRFHALATGDVEPEGHDVGKLTVFSGVSEFPVRVKCATLPWHTMRAALRQKTAAVTTE